MIQKPYFEDSSSPVGDASLFWEGEDREGACIWVSVPFAIGPLTSGGGGREGGVSGIWELSEDCKEREKPCISH